MCMPQCCQWWAVNCGKPKSKNASQNPCFEFSFLKSNNYPIFQNHHSRIMLQNSIFFCRPSTTAAAFAKQRAMRVYTCSLCALALKVDVMIIHDCNKPKHIRPIMW